MPTSGKGEKQVVAAPAAADAREAAVQVAAFEKALEHILFDGAAHPARSAQLRKVAIDALPQRTGARSARAIDAGRSASMRQRTRGTLPRTSATGDRMTWRYSGQRDRRRKR